MFCKHKWVKISENTLPSAFEQGARFNSYLPWAFVKKYILVLKCETCGKLETIREENP